MVQVVGILAVGAWSGIGTWILLWVSDKLATLRVAAEEETVGRTGHGRAGRVRKEADGKRTEDTIHEMDGQRADRIIDPKTIEPQNGDDHEYAGDDPRRHDHQQLAPRGGQLPAEPRVRGAHPAGAVGRAVLGVAGMWSTEIRLRNTQYVQAW